jgi:ATP-dependent DNA ligase
MPRRSRATGATRCSPSATVASASRISTSCSFRLRDSRSGAGRLDYIGFCSSFSAGERVALLDRLAPARGGTGFTGAAPGDSPSRWSRDPERDRSYVALAPQFVLEVGFDQVTGGRIRHGTRPLRWRTDKDPRSCTHEQLVVAGTALPLLDGAIRRP